MNLPSWLEKSHPELFPPSTLPLVVKAFHVAPPVAAISVMVRLDALTVPLACDNVATEPSVVDRRNFWLAPDVAKAPTVLVAPFFKSNVPFVSVKVLVAPSVSASWHSTVTFDEFIVMAWSIVMLFDVIFCVPDDFSMEIAPAVKNDVVMVGESLRSPNTLRPTNNQVPENPVKSMLPHEKPDPMFSDPDPAFTFTDIGLAELVLPRIPMVTPDRKLPIISRSGVPV